MFNNVNLKLKEVITKVLNLGGMGGIRTRDQSIMSRPLLPLSYHPQSMKIL